MAQVIFPPSQKTAFVIDMGPIKPGKILPVISAMDLQTGQVVTINKKDHGKGQFSANRYKKLSRKQLDAAKLKKREQPTWTPSLYDESQMKMLSIDELDMLPEAAQLDVDSTDFQDKDKYIIALLKTRKPKRKQISTTPAETASTPLVEKA